eukprot:Amastigsp_a5228_37.p3 type:complete len:156 gc:universal Amastigsp_a5228_37:612-1079(+)
MTGSKGIRSQPFQASTARAGSVTQNVNPTATATRHAMKRTDADRGTTEGSSVSVRLMAVTTTSENRTAIVVKRLPRGEILGLRSTARRAWVPKTMESTVPTATDSARGYSDAAEPDATESAYGVNSGMIAAVVQFVSIESARAMSRGRVPYGSRA